MSADYLALFLENLYLKNRLKQLTPQGTMDREVPASPVSDNTDLMD